MEMLGYALVWIGGICLTAAAANIAPYNGPAILAGIILLGAGLKCLKVI